MQLAQARQIRLVALGDQLISPTGDPKGMGWFGRVVAKTPLLEPAIEYFALPAPGETSKTMLDRWLVEVSLRFSQDTENYLVIALGNLDPQAGISISRSRLNLATILDEAIKAEIKCFVVGPTPVRDPEVNAEIEHLSSGYEDVAARRGVPFVDCFRPLVDHAGWQEDIAGNLARTPRQVGHGLLAWLVLNRGWYEWLGVESLVES